MKTKLGIVGCGFLGNIVADAWKKGLLPDYELAMAIPVLKRGVNLVILSIGAFADLDFYAQVKAAAVEGGAKVHLASGAIGGFDVLQTVTLMAQAQGLPETAGIETHTGAKGFRNTPVWAEHLLTDTEKTTVFTGNAKQAIATFPRPRDHRCDHALCARLGGRRPLHHCRDRGREGCGGYLLFHQRHCGLERRLPAAQSGLARLLLLI